MEGRSKQSQAGTQEQRMARNKDVGGSRSQGTAGCWRSQRVWEAEGSLSRHFLWLRSCCAGLKPSVCFFLGFFYTPVHTHTQMHAYILKSSSAYATLLCSPLWFSRCCSWRWHLTPLAAAFSWDSITACLAKADWCFKDNIFWGGFFFPSEKAIFLGGERHDL